MSATTEPALSNSFIFFNDPFSPDIYTLSLHDALPIYRHRAARAGAAPRAVVRAPGVGRRTLRAPRSEEHTSELQSRQYLVCRLLLEKKNTTAQSPSLPSSETLTLCRLTRSLTPKLRAC